MVNSKSLSEEINVLIKQKENQHLLAICFFVNIYLLLHGVMEELFLYLSHTQPSIVPQNPSRGAVNDNVLGGGGAIIIIIIVYMYILLYSLKIHTLLVLFVFVCNPPAPPPHTAVCK